MYIPDITQEACTSIGPVVALVSEFTLVGIAIAGGFFAVRVFFRLFTGQLQLLTGSPMVLGDSLVEIFGGMILMLFAYQAPAVGQQIAGLVCRASLNSGQAVVELFLELMVDPLLVLFSSLAIAAVFVTVVYAAFRSQIAVLSRSAGAIAENMTLAVSAVLFFAVVIVAFRVAISLVNM